MKFPNTLGKCADLLFDLRAKRQKMQAEVDKVEAEEKELKEHLIANLDKSDANGVIGLKAKANITSSVVATVKDWDAVYKYIAKTQSFELLHRRINDAAARELWAEKKEVPGVEPFTVLKVSVTKV